MRALLVVVVVAQAVVIGVWIYQLLLDQERPPDQRWFPRHRTLFICLESVVLAASLVAAVRLGD